MRSILWNCLFLIGLAGALTACQPAFINGTPNERSPYFRVPVGSRLVLQRSLPVSSTTDRLYFQDGGSRAWYDINLYRPYCALRLSTRDQTARAIEPDEFVVRKVWEERFYQLAGASTSLAGVELVAGKSRRLALAQIDVNDGGDDYFVEAAVMELRSARSPDAMRLICADWGLPQGAVYITVEKIRKALGEAFMLELASDSR